MEKSLNKSFQRRDALFLIILAIVLLVAFVILFFFIGETGSYATITVNGEEYGRYSLLQNQEIEITVDGSICNVAVIEDGSIRMEDANCPDKLCIHQGKIHRSGESIVCLPNRIAITIESSTDSEFDSISK